MMKKLECKMVIVIGHANDLDSDSLFYINVGFSQIFGFKMNNGV